MSAVSKWMYGGQDKQFFRDHEQDIHDFNSKMMGIFSVAATAILIGYCIFALATQIDNDIPFYIVLMFFVVLTYAAFKLFACKRIFWTKVYIQISIMMVAVFLQIHNVLEVDDLAVFVPAFFILLAPLLIIPMHYYIEFYTVMFIATVIMEFIYKSGKMYNVIYDIVDCFICAVIGIVLGQTVLKSRLTQIDAYTQLKATSETKLAKALKVANTDPLTGVGSRAAYENVCNELDDAIADHKPISFGLIVCDVNNLKERNDIGGHCAGDDLIRGTADLICDVFAKNNVYRIGGDEFVIILRENEYDLRNDLLNTMQARVQRVNTEVSFASGLAVFDPDKDTDIHSVFIRADAAMYDNKKKMKLLMASAE